ncbi:MAG: hypothetical protein M3237_17100 [Actinomycetota bacterium]|nr:hypothetical protein [Actinomycetota bacterium]
MTITTTTSTPATRRNVALVATRIFAGLVGSIQLAGALYFLFPAGEEAVWVGPWIDVPVVALLVGGVLLKLTVAVGPGLDARHRIGLGLVAVAVGIAVTLFKIPVYDEPESVTFLVVDAVLLTLLLLARRGDRPN